MKTGSSYYTHYYTLMTYFILMTIYDDHHVFDNKHYLSSLQSIKTTTSDPNL